MACPRAGWVLSALLSLLVLVRCGGDEPDDAAGPPGSAACAAGERPLPDGRCQPPGLPLDMPCPPGERALPASAGGRCQPAGVPPEACAAGKLVPDGRGGCAAILPEGACPSGQMAVPGEHACREVAPCGDGTWGDIPVEATTEYVDQGYPGGDSDGSQQKPWKTVQEGVEAASPGAIVAIAAGRYTEDVLIRDKPVRLWGRCPARTSVVGSGAQPGIITLSSEGASESEVRGVAVTGPSTGILVDGSRSVVIEEAWVHDAGPVGVALVNRADASLRGALLERNRELGLLALSSEATVVATAVRATRLDPNGEYGWGLGVDVDPAIGEPGKLSLTASLVEDNQELGVVLFASYATIDASVIRATRPNGAGAYGHGISIHASRDTGEPAKLSLTGSLVEDNQEIGVFVGGSEATIEGTVVRATQTDGSGKNGRGIDVEESPQTGNGGELRLTASLVEENHDTGVYIGGSEATVEATLVRATQTDGAGNFGRGIGVEVNLVTGAGGTLRLKESVVEANHDIGVFLSGAAATVEATVVRATQPSREGMGGRGMSAQADPGARQRGTLSLAASLIEENHDVGVFIAGPEARIEATLVRATKRAPVGVEYGDGILVRDGLGQSDATIAATASVDNGRAGVLYVGSTGELSFVRSSGNRFGLVLQPGMSGAGPALGEENAFVDNTERDEVKGGDLPVPDAAQPLP